jgi:hypothetical protein
MKISGIAIVLSLLLNFNQNADAGKNLTRVPELNKHAVSGIKNIVLVHGAFVDGSGWKPVYDTSYSECTYEGRKL